MASVLEFLLSNSIFFSVFKIWHHTSHRAKAADFSLLSEFLWWIYRLNDITLFSVLICVVMDVLEYG